MKERIQKLMAMANIASRRASEEMIRAGRVRVNGQIAGIGDKADPATDVITVDGAALKFSGAKRYIAYYKPVNVLSSNKRQKGDNRSTVREVIPVEGHLFTIGRLDAESEGLMVLTNDGELAHRLTHPRYEHTKTYKVTVYGKPTQETLDAWERGVWLDDERTAPCSIRVHESDNETTTLRIVMVEGRKRQIRRVASQLGHPVKRLMRTHIGSLNVGTLRRGEWLDLTEEDVQALQVPVSDISYIRRLRKEQRQQRKREFVRRQKQGTPPPSAATPEGDAPPMRRRPAGGQAGRKQQPVKGRGGAGEGDKPARRRPSSRPATPSTGGRAHRPKPAGGGSGSQAPRRPPDKPRTPRKGR